MPKAGIIWFSTVAALMMALAAGSGKFLVKDMPGKADVILVLAGDTNLRPARALELLRRGYAPRIILDVPADARVFQWSEAELAERYVQGLPEARSITICSIHGLSTETEAQDASLCLREAGANNVLLVTSDFHTRRALSVFEKEVPNHAYSVAATSNADQFGAQWWRHRQWAKVNLDEWMRLAWWELVDRWR